jgi:hypothetical protein
MTRGFLAAVAFSLALLTSACAGAQPRPLLFLQPDDDQLAFRAGDFDGCLVDVPGNRVNVTKTDITASNGVIHVVDAVLMPTRK